MGCNVSNPKDSLDNSHDSTERSIIKRKKAVRRGLDVTMMDALWIEKIEVNHEKHYYSVNYNGGKKKYERISDYEPPKSNEDSGLPPIKPDTASERLKLKNLDSSLHSKINREEFSDHKSSIVESRFNYLKTE